MGPAEKRVEVRQVGETAIERDLRDGPGRHAQFPGGVFHADPVDVI